MTSTETVAALRELGEQQWGSRQFVGADLAGADLSGLQLRWVNLSRADLTGANLSGAQFDNVLLTGAILKEANLRGARLLFVDATEVDLSGAGLGHSRWEHVVLTGGRLDQADMTRCLIHTCTAEETSFAGADLTGGGIVYSLCNRASFRAAKLTDMESVGTSFRDADFADAEQFYSSHEIVAEVLRQNAPMDIEVAKFIGSITVMRKWCYAEWKEHLATPDREQYFEIARGILKAYPPSLAGRALEEGWDWRRVESKGSGDD